MSRLTTSMSCAVTIQSVYTHDGDDVPCRTNAIHGMSYADVFSVLEKLQATFPWFRECAQAATLTEIGKRHDVLEHLDHINDEMELPDAPEPHVSLQSEMKVMREAARALESNSGRNQKNSER